MGLVDEYSGSLAIVTGEPPPNGEPPDEEEEDWKKWLPIILAVGLAAIIITGKK